MENPQRDLDQEIQELEETLRKKKLEAETQKTIVVSVKNVTTESVIFSADYRRDHHELLLSLKCKKDTVNNTWWLYLKDYPTWIAWIKEAKNVQFLMSVSDRKKVDYYLNGPDVAIELGRSTVGKPIEFRIKIKPNLIPRDYFGELTDLLIYNHTTEKYHLTLLEASKLYAKVQNSVVWEDDAKKYAIEQAKNRSELADIANLEFSEDGLVPMGNKTLRPFQTVGVAYQKAINYRGIIGDEMGLGKTLQGIATAIKAESKRIAVICPASLRENWRREILDTTGERALMLSGTVPDPVEVADIVSGNYKFFIMNYDMLARPIKELKEENGIITRREVYPWVMLINSLGFDHVIVDEAHRIKNIEASRTKAILKINIPRITCLTGTPVINRPAELYASLHWIAPQVFPTYDGFVSRYSDGKNGARNVDELKKKLAPFFIRRRKRDVVKDLPPIVRSTRLISLSDSDRDSYEKLMAQIRIDIKTGEEIGNINNILEKLLRIKQFLSDRKCDSVADFATETYDEAESDDKYKKIIIFTQFTSCVDKISRLLGGECLTIVGSRHTPTERQHIVDKFQRESDYKYLICSIQAASEGLNITAAGHVIFNDFMWGPAIHHQAEGRAYGRLNDAHTIESHYFAVENTLDDWLQKIIQDKLNTIEAVVEDMGEVRSEESSILKSLFNALREGLL